MASIAMSQHLQTHVEHLLAAAEQAGRGWAKERSVRLYGEALELVPEDDADRRRQIRMRQAVHLQALFRYRDVARHARSQVLLAAGAHGVAAIDAVHLDLADAAGLRAEAADATALGFAATACVHPGQVEVVRAAYAPSAERLEWARAMLAEAGAREGDGVFAFRGQMVDAPLLRQAEAVVRRGRPHGGDEEGTGA